MANKRKIPFGYRMESGTLLPQTTEAETVRWIYASYLRGNSLKGLADKLREQGVPYMEGKVWNKNMVARILEDQRYAGTEDFPAIIEHEQFRAVKDQRRQFACTRVQTAAQKGLRQLCGVPPCTVEERVLHLLNYLIDTPSKIRLPETCAGASEEEKRLRRELDELLQTKPVDDETARRKALELASVKIERIGSEEYETLRLCMLFAKRERMTELDAELLQQTIKMVAYEGDRLMIRLKNNQWIGEGELE